MSFWLEGAERERRETAAVSRVAGWGPAFSLNKALVSSNSVLGAALTMSDGITPRLRITSSSYGEQGEWVPEPLPNTCKSLTRSREEPEQG